MDMDMDLASMSLLDVSEIDPANASPADVRTTARMRQLVRRHSASGAGPLSVPLPR